ncbi:hypothetical protein [Kineosporia sp. R_H_3]|uniref:hypothetical protein n=1 Tax=Kineosporia sp. R_H_3 TaxID=1961848 RepID=UPI00117BB67B|nr:hypothetical protein [Kineosporia sp. R_H_3]
MTDNHPHQPGPETPPARQPQSGPSAEAINGRVPLGERAADNLIRMATAASGTVIDLDEDPTLRAAALALGRSYLAVDLTTIDTPPDRPADLVVLRWPRPGDHSWLSTAGEVFAGAEGILAQMGRVAVLLDPTAALEFGITWTGTLLAAATTVGLPVLQDVVCMHDLESEAVGQSEASGSATLRHRVILLLGTGRARHVAH